MALELLNAMEKVASAQFTFPEDLEEDIDHFLRQLKTLKFTEAELEESEEVELKALQEENLKKNEENFNASPGVETPPTKTTTSGSGSGSLPTGAINNIKPFRSAAVASAAAVEELDDTWEEIEHEEEEGEGGEQEGQENQDYITNDEETENEEVLNNGEKEKEEISEKINENKAPEGEEGEGVLHEIPPPDENLLKVLDQEGVAYVNLDNPTETMLPPDAPVPGAVEPGEDINSELPSDPFKMQEGAEAQVQEDARLSDETLQELEELKRGPDSSVAY